MAKPVKQLAWGEFGASDFVRLPGSARDYALKDHPEVVISRRQYDKHYGALAKQGYKSFEEKARASAEKLLRPARGRKKARVKTEAEKTLELRKREAAETEKRVASKINGAKAKRFPKYDKITMSQFPKGSSLRKFRVAPTYEAIETVRRAGAATRFVYSYYVTLIFASDSGTEIEISIMSAAPISQSFREEDLKRGLDKWREAPRSKSSGGTVATWEPIAAVVTLKLRESYARKNGWGAKKK